MGYTSTAEGEIKISPPLCHWELRALPDLGQPYGEELDLVIRTLEVEEDTGTLVTKFASVVRPLDGDSNLKRYNTADQLKVLVKAFPEHNFSGYFEFLGEDGERWRTVMKDGRVIDNVKPELRWPE